jgi:L-threonylcarbamoyladenylate synthase
MANIPTPKGAIRLASPSTVENYAHCLYEALRLCDNKNIKKVIVIQPEGVGIALAIRDRLRKSASTSKAINI